MNNKFIFNFKEYSNLNESSYDSAQEFCKEVLRDISNKISGTSTYKYESFTAEFDLNDLLKLSQEERELHLNFSTDIHITLKLGKNNAPNIFDGDGSSDAYSDLLGDLEGDYSLLGDLGISDPYTYKVRLGPFDFSASIDSTYQDVATDSWGIYNNFNIEIKKYDSDNDPLSLSKYSPDAQFNIIPGKPIKYSTSSTDPEISGAIDDILQFLSDTPFEHFNEEFLQR